MKRELNQNLFGNEVYNTDSLILLEHKMLCSKLHCQKGFNLLIFPYQSGHDHTVDYSPLIKSLLVPTQSTFRPRVVQIWPRNTPESGRNETGVLHRMHRINQMVLESQPPHKIVKLLFTIRQVDDFVEKLTF